MNCPAVEYAKLVSFFKSGTRLQNFAQTNITWYFAIKWFKQPQSLWTWTCARFSNEVDRPWPLDYVAFFRIAAAVERCTLRPCPTCPLPSSESSHSASKTLLVCFSKLLKWDQIWFKYLNLILAELTVAKVKTQVRRVPNGSIVQHGQNAQWYEEEE